MISAVSPPPELSSSHTLDIVLQNSGCRLRLPNFSSAPARSPTNDPPLQKEEFIFSTRTVAAGPAASATSSRPREGIGFLAGHLELVPKAGVLRISCNTNSAISSSVTGHDTLLRHRHLMERGRGAHILPSHWAIPESTSVKALLLHEYDTLFDEEYNIDRSLGQIFAPRVLPSTAKRAIVESDFNQRARSTFERFSYLPAELQYNIFGFALPTFIELKYQGLNHRFLPSKQVTAIACVKLHSKDPKMASIVLRSSFGYFWPYTVFPLSRVYINPSIHILFLPDIREMDIASFIDNPGNQVIQRLALAPIMKNLDHLDSSMECAHPQTCPIEYVWKRSGISSCTINHN